MQMEKTLESLFEGHRKFNLAQKRLEVVRLARSSKIPPSSSRQKIIHCLEKLASDFCDKSWTTSPPSIELFFSIWEQLETKVKQVMIITEPLLNGHYAYSHFANDFINYTKPLLLEPMMVAMKVYSDYFFDENSMAYRQLSVLWKMSFVSAFTDTSSRSCQHWKQFENFSTKFTVQGVKIPFFDCKLQIIQKAILHIHGMNLSVEEVCHIIDNINPAECSEDNPLTAKEIEQTLSQLLKVNSPYAVALLTGAYPHEEQWKLLVDLYEQYGWPFDDVEQAESRAIEKAIDELITNFERECPIPAGRSVYNEKSAKEMRSLILEIGNTLNKIQDHEQFYETLLPSLNAKLPQRGFEFHLSKYILHQFKETALKQPKNQQLISDFVRNTVENGGSMVARLVKYMYNGLYNVFVSDLSYMAIENKSVYVKIVEELILFKNMSNVKYKLENLVNAYKRFERFSQTNTLSSNGNIVCFEDTTVLQRGDLLKAAELNLPNEIDTVLEDFGVFYSNVYMCERGSGEVLYDESKFKFELQCDESVVICGLSHYKVLRKFDEIDEIAVSDIEDKPALKALLDHRVLKLAAGKVSVAVSGKNVYKLATV